VSRDGYFGIVCENGLLAFRFYETPRGEPMIEVAVGRQTRTLRCAEFATQVLVVTEEATNRVLDKSKRSA
jgi:hypothetical protein